MKSFMQMYQLLEAATPAELIKLLQKGKGQQKLVAPQPPVAPSPVAAPAPQPPVAPSPVAAPAAVAPPEDDDFSLDLGDSKHTNFVNSLSPELQEKLKVVQELTRTAADTLWQVTQHLDSLWNQVPNEGHGKKLSDWIKAMKKDTEKAIDDLYAHNMKVLYGI